MASTTLENLRGLIYSGVELKETHPTWSDAFIEDYLNIFNNFLLLAEMSDRTLEEIPTDFTDGSIPFAYGGFLEEDNTNLVWSKVYKILGVKALVVNDTSADLLLSTNSSKQVASVPDLTVWISGSDLQPVNDDGDGTVSHNDDELEFYIQAVA